MSLVLFSVWRFSRSNANGRKKKGEKRKEEETVTENKERQFTPFPPLSLSLSSCEDFTRGILS
jgi:hypothetical protein